MDLFGSSSSSSSSSDDEGDGTNIGSVDAVADMMINQLFAKLLQIRLFVKFHRLEDGKIEKHAKKLLIVDSRKVRKQMETLRDKLAQVGFNDIRTVGSDNLPDVVDQFDIILDLSEECLQYVACIEKLVLPGGYFLCSSTSGIIASLDQMRWSAAASDSVEFIKVLRRRYCQFNCTGAIYWASVDEEALIREQAVIEEVTIPLTSCERARHILGVDSHSHAVEAMRKHGLCILSGMFPSDMIQNIGDYALKDLEIAIEKLLERGIDLLRPGEGPQINNFHELSMREAMRCDLRNGKNMAKAISGCDGFAGVDTLANNSSVVRFLSEAMYLPGEHEMGNWGRWNFGGGGPQQGPPPLKVGQMGAVMSLPGCGDQTIHADTPHVFVHTHLPAHYVNMFLIALDTLVEGADFSIGQTAFVVGSHKLEVSENVMTSSVGEKELKARLIRPHLTAGDALFFDCRILHFGLANQSNTVHLPTSRAPQTLYRDSLQIAKVRSRIHSTNDEAGYSLQKRLQHKLALEESYVTSADAIVTDSSVTMTIPRRRPLLYVNYHHDWFHDPKNWNDKERLFV